jgi:hypothetical protein
MKRLFALVLVLLPLSCTSKSAITNYAGEGASEVESYATVEDMAAKADLVVVGTPSVVRDGPRQSEFGTAVVTLKGTRVLGSRWTAPTGDVQIGFVLGPSTDTDSLRRELSSALPKGKSIWFLRYVEPDIYVPVTQAAIVEAGSKGTQPAFYRASAESYRSSKQKPDEHGDLIMQLASVELDQLEVVASKVAAKGDRPKRPGGTPTK